MNFKKRVIAVGMAGAIVLGIAAPGAGAAVTVAPESINFGPVPVGGTSAPQMAILTVSCAPDPATPPQCFAPAFFTTNISAPAPFSQTNDCLLNYTVSITPGQSCTISVRFSPTAAGSAAGTLQTGAGGPTVALSGSGIAAPAAQVTATPVATKKKCKKKAKKSASSAKKKCKKKKK